MERQVERCTSLWTNKGCWGRQVYCSWPSLTHLLEHLSTGLQEMLVLLVSNLRPPEHRAAGVQAVGEPDEVLLAPAFMDCYSTSALPCMGCWCSWSPTYDHLSTALHGVLVLLVSNLQPPEHRTAGVLRGGSFSTFEYLANKMKSESRSGWARAYG
jgi:hypothetical protein